MGLKWSFYAVPKVDVPYSFKLAPCPNECPSTFLQCTFDLLTIIYGFYSSVQTFSNIEHVVRLIFKDIMMKDSNEPFII